MVDLLKGSFVRFAITDDRYIARRFPRMEAAWFMLIRALTSCIKGLPMGRAMQNSYLIQCETDWAVT